ncbi:(2Fe-2S)-binding protein [Mycobacteroides abscessus]|uniref:(2Fe-2S)-binding protein n=1 Tax=Mycobacteroides abscessus TaxID=36809 RepID=UPI0009262B54|nr:(2Fe-2S)-binding protein [Mycobacteroides abscessus]MDM2422906.1 (2Fe-2S)-binding protein [Mycobacteroides abscessus]MDM2427984.1 (2Fe-2S)-binding protein [Mycobacteroides abscessus]MDM2430860.1 (2Fe-2S)-binding protein [Mycobacteroides abscessus]MDM2438153.1 (2Fe-2S)-binding protein [Mycobacteroides abscessus]MDM2442619.1 (2Fe-2S)-binding protein [Mycobacteroides abscessus]
MSAVEQSVFGPFFTVEAHAADETPAPPWRSVSGLVDGSPSLGDRISAVRSSLAARIAKTAAEVDLRVAASVTHLGLIARILAPTIAAATCGVRISQELDDLWWQDRLGGPFPLSVLKTESDHREAECSAVPGAAVESITRCVVGETGVSDRVLWGNVGSAANSAARLIAASRPALTGAARDIADTYLRDPRVEGGVLRAGPGFRRRSCCLIYRLAEDRTAVCGDCVLETRAGATG